MFQTVLPALLTAGGESRVRITGGTHNRASPPFDFLARSFLPLLGRMGADVQLDLTSYGFFPRGGGEIRARITPAARLAAINLTERGAWVRGLRGSVCVGDPDPRGRSASSRSSAAR